DLSLGQRPGVESHMYSLLNPGAGVVRVGANGRVYRSTDGGQSWDLPQRLGSERYVYSLATAQQPTNQPPVANAGPDQQARVNETVYLDGSGSYDPDGDPILGWNWYFVSKPPGSTAEIINAHTSAPSFVPDIAGEYVVELVVSDGELDSEPDQVTILVTVDSFVFTELKTYVPRETFASTELKTYVPRETFVFAELRTYVPRDTFVNTILSNYATIDTFVFTELKTYVPRDTFVNTILSNYATVDTFVFAELKTHVPRDIFARTILTTLPVTGSPFARFVPDKAGTYIVGLIVSDGELWSEEDQVVIVVAGPKATLVETELSTAVHRDTLSEILLTTWPPHNTFSEVRLTRPVKRDTLCEVRVATKNFVQPEPS